MSNSFNRGKTGESIGLSSILSAIASELAITAASFTELGELLSDNLSDPEAKRKNYDLQAFDALSQAVEAQARLLKKLSDCERDGIPANLDVMLEDIPFSRIRQRMRAAANGDTAPSFAGTTDDPDVNWF